MHIIMVSCFLCAHFCSVKVKILKIVEKGHVAVNPSELKSSLQETMVNYILSNLKIN